MDNDITDQGDKIEESSSTISTPDIETPETEVETEPEAKVEGEVETKETEVEAVQPKRGAAERIGQLIRKNKELENILSGKEAEVKPDATSTNLNAGGKYEPEIQTIVDNLRNLGFVRTEDVKSQLDLIEAKQILESEHSRLEGTYNGTDNRPKYDRKKVSDYAYEKGIYDLETAYESLNKPELMDWAIKQAQKETGKTPSSEKPTRSSRTGSDTITRDLISKVTATPEGREWYDKNHDKIISLLQRGELE
jgi:hypothetical protein